MAGDAQFENVADVYAAAYAWMETVRAPRDPTGLLALVDLVAPAAGGVGADLGAYDGWWAATLGSRYECRMVAVDVALRPLAGAAGRGLLTVNADMQAIPFRAASLSLVWSRDVLSMVNDPRAATREIARVLKPGCGAVIYSAMTTPRLEPVERAVFLDALEAPAWWAEGRGPIDEAIQAAGLEVMHEERFSPEGQEVGLAEQDEELLNDLVLLARIQRDGQSLEALLGPRWVARITAWGRWPLYLLLGKLETRAWVLRKPT